MIDMNQYQSTVYPYGPGMGGGYRYPGDGKPVKATNPLTNEEIAQLRTKVSQFTLALTKDEVLRGVCFHRDENGQQSTITNADGSCTCTICGHTWRSDPMTEEQVQNAVNMVVDILQTIKLLYINFPDQAAREFYQIIPLLNKVPGLYKIASDNFRSYENVYGQYSNGVFDPFAMFGQINNGMFNQAQQYNMTGQPGMNMYAPPAFGGSPVGNPFDAMQYGVPNMMGTTMGAPMGAPAGQPATDPALEAAAKAAAEAAAKAVYEASAKSQGYVYTPGAAAPADAAKPVVNGDHTP